MNLFKNLNFNFIMIYIIHKTVKNNQNYLKDSIFEHFLKTFLNRLLFFQKKIFFS